LDEPLGSVPGGDLVEGVVAAQSGPEAEAVPAEPRFIVRLQDELDRLLNEAIPPARGTQGTCATLLLRDVGPTDGCPHPLAVPEQSADPAALTPAHPIDGLPVHTGRERAVVRADLGVRRDQHLLTTEMPVHPLQGQASPASILKDLDQRMDGLHSQYS